MLRWDGSRRKAFGLSARELNAVVGRDGVDAVRDACDRPFKEVLGVLPGGPVVRRGKGEPARAVYGDEQVELAFLGARLRDVDVEAWGSYRSFHRELI